MTREQIEKAARKYAFDNAWYPGETSYESDIRAMEESFADAFMDGAQWRINSVWHDAIDKPERNRDFLYESARGWFGINNTTKMAREVYPEKWDRFVEGYDVIRWVYIDDLLPERKEETE